MRCKLGKQAIVDAVLDYLENKCNLSHARNISPLGRIMRLREGVEWKFADEVWSGRSVDDDDFDNWHNNPPDKLMV